MKNDYKEGATKTRTSFFFGKEEPLNPYRPKDKRTLAYASLDKSSLGIRASGTSGVMGSREFKFQELAMLSISPIFRSIQNWWLQRAERHYLICADVELQRAREAQLNVAYYQKRAALARSARH